MEHSRERPWYESVKYVQQSRETSQSVAIGSKVTFYLFIRGKKIIIFSPPLKIFQILYKHVLTTEIHLAWSKGEQLLDDIWGLSLSAQTTVQNPTGSKRWVFS